MLMFDFSELMTGPGYQSKMYSYIPKNHQLLLRSVLVRYLDTCLNLVFPAVLFFIRIFVLYSQNKTKKGNLEGISHEVDLYIKHINERFGRFEYAPFKTPYDPKSEEDQIKTLYPKCSLPFELGPLDNTLRRRKRTYSFSGSERESMTGTPTPSDLDDSVNHLGGNATLKLAESQHTSTLSNIKGNV